MVRVKMHVNFNKLIVNQFRLNLISSNIPEPRIFRNFKQDATVERSSNDVDANNETFESPKT